MTVFSFQRKLLPLKFYKCSKSCVKSNNVYKFVSFAIANLIQKNLKRKSGDMIL